MRRLLNRMLRTAAVMLTAGSLAATHAADLTVRVSTAHDGTVQIQAAGTQPNDGYAAQVCTGLNHAAWCYVDSPDRWPAGGTNWSADVPADASFYRLRQAPRGTLLDFKAQMSWSAAAIEVALAANNMDFFAPVYGVDVYSLRYQTFDHRGLSTVASGAVCVPTGPDTAPLLSYQHGTLYLRTAAPSNPNAADQAMGIAFASEGYVVALPDYLGLGTNSPPLHPYVHARSEAIACADMLRAVKTFMENDLSMTHNGELFLAGYSQGGHATLALQKELELHHALEFPVTASAPMAGPHDLSATMTDAMLSNTPYPSPGYVAYLLFAYNGVYGFFADASEVLTAPYDTTLPPLFDGAHAGSEVDAAMPAIPKEIFKAGFLADFESNTNHAFRAALRANDTYRHWVPSVTTRLYHCASDTTVPAVNSRVAYSNFVDAGSTSIALEDPAPAADHTAGVLPCFEAAQAWFDSLRAP